jgi:hypothetical protein
MKTEVAIFPWKGKLKVICFDGLVVAAKATTTLMFGFGCLTGK